jgi:Yip1 domain
MQSELHQGAAYMSTFAPDLPLPERESALDDFLGMFSFFIDPEGAAKRVRRKWFWIGPFIVMTIVTIISGILMTPIVQHVLEVAPMPPNASPEQYQQGIAMAMKVQKVILYLAPIIVAIILVIQVLILFATCTVASVKAPFLWLFNLAAGCGLIATLGSIASLVVLKAKGQVETKAELQPPLGLDIFLSDQANKFLASFLGYFSIFNIWWIVMMVLILSATFRVSKGKAFGIVLPWILLCLILKVASAAFQR